MMRRRLAAYTIMLIAGISAGYYIFEKIRLLSGFAFLTCAGIAVFLSAEGDDERRIKKEKAHCFIILLLGLLLFALNYARYEGRYVPGEQISIHGRVVSAEDKGDKLRLVIKDEKSKCRFITNIRGCDEMKMNPSGDHASEISLFTGSKVSLRGEIGDIAEADNPGCFDYRMYMRSKGIACSVKVECLDINEDDKVNLIYSIRKYLINEREKFLAYFSEDCRAFLRGMIFGDKSEIDEKLRREFNLNSSGHILAVSGLHIGFLHSLLKLLSGRRKTLPASLLIIMIMIVYGEMSMWSSSTIRAVIVISLSILSVNLHRAFDLLSSLAAAAFLILMARPYMLFNTGFQLSFAAMCSISILSKYINVFLGNMLCTAASVQLGTLPLIAHSFHRVNTLALLINIPIIMLSSFIVPLCIMMIFISMMISGVPEIFITIISVLTEGLISMNHTLSFDGVFSVLSSGPGSGLTASFYVMSFFLASEWMRVNIIRRNYALIKKNCILILFPLIFMNVALINNFKYDEVVFVSVGQGDCTHIRCGDTDVMIDGGGSDFVNTGERTLMPYLLTQGADNLDAALLTHLHKDHYLGISELSEIYPIQAVAMPSEYRESYEKMNMSGRDEAAENDIVSFKTGQIIYLHQNSRINISNDVFVEILWPLSDRKNSFRIDDPNEHNMVYMIHYRGCRIMVTGDLLEEDELKMVSHYRGSDVLKCDILKVAHHGSKSSSSEAFLDAANPEIAVIQVGRNNFYGHPHARTLDRLEDRGIRTYRSDIHGAVGIDINKRSGKFRVHAMHNSSQCKQLSY